MTLMFAAVIAVFAIVGCEKPSEVVVDDSMVVLADSQKDDITVNPSGETLTIRFTAALDWTVRVPEGADWIEVSPVEGVAGMARLKVKADVNESQSKREAVIEICSGPTVKAITLSQEVFIPTFELLSTEKSVSCLGGDLTVQVSTDVNFEYEVLADWIKPADTKAVLKYAVRFVVEPNDGEERTAVITFCSDESCKSFTVTQRAAGTSAEDWKYDEFRHRSLAMRFTADWCGYCPYMATAFESAKAEMLGGLEVVSLHGDGSSYYFSGSDNLMSRFSVSSLPTGVIDSRARVANSSATSITAGNAVDVAKETKASYPVTVGIACNSSLSGTDLTVNLDLYLKEADVYRTVILVLEDGIVGYQNNGGNNYEHNDVARYALTSMNGDKIETTEDFQIVSKTYTASLKSSWKAENLKLLIYVEKPYGERSKAKGVSGVTYGNYGDTYIDNCRVVKVGVEAPLDFE